MVDRTLVMLGTDAAATEEYFDTFRRSQHLEPEKMLLFAILEDAVHCYRKYSEAKDRAGKERYREAQQWIMRGENDWIFSFDNVCELLGLDPQYVRQGLLESSANIAEQEQPGRRHGLRRQAP